MGQMAFPFCRGAKVPAAGQANLLSHPSDFCDHRVYDAKPPFDQRGGERRFRVGKTPSRRRLTRVNPHFLMRSGPIPEKWREDWE